MRPSRILAVDHVLIESPQGLDDDLRWFYTEVAKLDELPVENAAGALLRFRSERIELRVQLLAAPRIDPVAVRASIAVRSLEEACELLGRRRVDYEPITGLAFTDRRIQTVDPAGNRILLRHDSSLLPF